MRILIVDKEAAVRQGYRHALAGDFHEAMFGEAATVRQVSDLLERVRWDVVVMGNSPQRRDRLEGLRQIRGVDARVPILLVVSSDDAQVFADVGSVSGASCVTTPEALLAAVSVALTGSPVGGRRPVNDPPPGLDEVTDPEAGLAVDGDD